MRPDGDDEDWRQPRRQNGCRGSTIKIEASHSESIKQTNHAENKEQQWQRILQRTPFFRKCSTTSRTKNGNSRENSRASSISGLPGADRAGQWHPRSKSFRKSM